MKVTQMPPIHICSKPGGKQWQQTYGLTSLLRHRGTYLVMNHLCNLIVSKVLIEMLVCCLVAGLVIFSVWVSVGLINSLRPRQNGRHFPDDIFTCIFFNENASISIEISLKFVPKCLINNIPALVQIMAWCQPGNKPLSEPVMVNLLTHICVTQCLWVNWLIDWIQQFLTQEGQTWHTTPL